MQEKKIDETKRRKEGKQKEKDQYDGLLKINIDYQYEYREFEDGGYKILRKDVK